MTKTRLEAFSDGVIAILITIMVLELRPPAHGPEGFHELKHAFPAGWPGTIALEAWQDGAGPVLRIADDGIGMDVEARTRDRRTIGLDVMRALAAQLDARLEIDGDHGVDVRLTFNPAPDPQGVD